MILLFSGGIDSFVAYHFLNKPQTVYFNLHTAYSEKEMRVVKKLIPETIIEDCIDFKSREVSGTAYVPYRNLHLALLANKYSDTIVIAGLQDDVVNDKNEAIFAEFSKLMSTMMGRKIEVISPFWNMTKERVVMWYRNNVPEGPSLIDTISCYSKEDTNYCAACPACFRKWNALYVNGIKLPFENDILMEEYYQKARKGIYITERNQAIMEAVVDFQQYRPGGYVFL